MLVVPGSVGVKAQAEAEGLDRVFLDAGAEWRGAGCSMCLGMNPDQLQPGERSASTSNRNFQGRQGKGGRTHLVSPGRRRRHRPHREAHRPRRPRRTLESELDGRLHHPHRHRRPAAPQQRRHRPDHPGRVPEADHPHRLRGRPVRRLADATSPTSCSTSRSTPTPRSWSPAPTSAPAPPASTPSGRCWTAASGRSSARGSPTSSATTRPRPGCSPSLLPQADVEALWTAIEADPATEVTVDLEAKEVRYGAIDGRLRDRRLHPLAAARGAGRRRPHRAAPRRHRGVRGARPAWLPKALPGPI